MAHKRKLANLQPEIEEPVDPADELMFLCLGGGNEVGRSCHIIQYKGKTVMLDAGMHAGYQGLAALPYYDEFDLGTVDILLISQYVFSLLFLRGVSLGVPAAGYYSLLREVNLETLSIEAVRNKYWEDSANVNYRQIIFHVDHAASLPYVLAKTNFRGRVFMTHPTKAIYKWMIQDSVRVSNTSSSSESQTELYTEADHFATFPMIEAIDFYTTHTISSIRITPYPAGHVLGAAMFLIEIAGLKILFTGDYSREDDRHLIPAQVPQNTKIDVLITESTFGISSHIPRLERETALLKGITGILNRGGRVLMPVSSVGRTQELLLILDEYWARHPELQKIPIYYASNLARKCMVVYQTYISAMNDNIKRLFRERMAEAERAGDVNRGGPWDFQFIRSLKSLDRFDDVGGCVMLASPGMLQNGPSRILLERWAPSDKNGVIITGYNVEGTMAKQIQQEPETIPAIMGTKSTALARGKGMGGDGQADKPMIPRRCSVQEFSFAAHVDGQENREFIESVAAPVVILVHGEKHNMLRLKSKLLSLNADKTTKVKIYSPANTEELRIPFKAEKTARVVGRLAQLALPSTKGDDDAILEDSDLDAQLISGVLVQNDFKMSLMAAEDLREYAGLTTTTITCKQRLTLSAAGLGLIKWALEGTFGSIEEIRLPNAAATNGHANTNGSEVTQDRVNGTATNGSSHGPVALRIMGCVTVMYQHSGEVTVEWEGNTSNDGIADAVMAVLLTVESTPASVKESSQQHHHSHSHSHSHNHRNPHANVTPEERFSRLCMFLEAQFGSAISPIAHPPHPPEIIIMKPKQNGVNPTSDAESSPLKKAGNPSSLKPELAEDGDGDANMSDAGSSPSSNDDDDDNKDNERDEDAEEEALAEWEAAELERLHDLGIPVPGVEIRVDKHVAKVWLETLEVECAQSVLRDRVKAVVERAVETIAPLWGGADTAGAASGAGRRR
ncbi:endoribonuclease ysh1 [Agyrium rufum]|nr:endoribonuclease ysh1 [Agyrium rufum]